MPRSLLSRWAPVVAWAGFIFALSSVPHLGTDLGTWDLVLRKVAHAGEYAVLAILLARATRSLRAALVLAVLYAGTDEVHQVFVEGRNGAALDVLIDAVGAAGGVAAGGWRPIRERFA